MVDRYERDTPWASYRVVEHHSSKAQQCQATRKDGTPCRATAVLNGHCIGHREGSVLARKKGGLGRSTANRLDKYLPPRLRDAADLIKRTMHEVYQGDMETRQGHAIAALATALVKVMLTAEVQERASKGLGRGDDKIRVDPENIAFTLHFDHPGDDADSYE